MSPSLANSQNCSMTSALLWGLTTPLRNTVSSSQYRCSTFTFKVTLEPAIVSIFTATRSKSCTVPSSFPFELSFSIYPSFPQSMKKFSSFIKSWGKINSGRSIVLTPPPQLIHGLRRAMPKKWRIIPSVKRSRSSKGTANVELCGPPTLLGNRGLSQVVWDWTSA